MLRRVLACFALITGLAAIGAPVQVSAAVAMAEQVESSREAKATGKRQDCANQQPSTLGQSDGEKRKPCAKLPIIRILIPSVMLRADRAYE